MPWNVEYNLGYGDIGNRDFKTAAEAHAWIKESPGDYDWSWDNLKVSGDLGEVDVYAFMESGKRGFPVPNSVDVAGIAEALETAAQSVRDGHFTTATSLISSVTQRLSLIEEKIPAPDTLTP